MSIMNENCPTLLEYLPNELFAQIFSYLNNFDGTYAFLYLNYRFQCLLLQYNHQSLDFKSVNKHQFDIAFQLFDTQQWKSLRLSNADDTYGQIEYFFQNYSFVKHFPQLESLSIMSIKPLNESILLPQLPFLRNLVSLTLEPICGERMSEFNLPNLKRLVFASCTNTNWIRNFSQLENIEYTITDCYKYEKNLIWPSKLKRLKIIFASDEDVKLVQSSLTHLSQLVTLEIYQKEREIIAPNGQTWQQIIQSSFPLLKNFRFYFQFEYVSYTSEKLDQIIVSFNTPFYELEKQWLVRCDIRYRDRPFAAIYSLPFAFDRFTIFTNSFDKQISPLIESDNSNVFANIKTLIFEEKSVIPGKDFNKIHVTNLILNTYFDSVNWLHTLTKLRHLEIQSGARLSSENFSLLLNNTPYLYSLVIDKNVLWLLTDNCKNVSVCKQLSEKIRSLKFISNGNRSQCLDKGEIKPIIRTFASKCAHLSLSVYSEIKTIRLILRQMRQLTSLHVRIQGKDYPPITIEWLNKKRTEINFNHTNCFIVNDGYDRYFWFGKHS